MALILAGRCRSIGRLCLLHHLTWRCRQDSSAKHLFIPIKLHVLGPTSCKATNERLTTVNISTPIRWIIFFDCCN